MHDNPQTSQNRAFRLSGHAVLALEGQDSASFANAQFASDVAALEPGHWHWSCWLTPKGRVLAVFALLRLEHDRFWMLLPDADAVELGDALRRFVFRSKVRIEPRPELAASGRFACPAGAAGNRLHVEGSNVELDAGSPTTPRGLSIAADLQGVAPDPVAEAAWRRFDLEHGLPRLPAGQSGQWTPQQLSLERLRAYSVRKGCYPGQEIVARTHFLGKAKRGLALLESPAPIDPGTEVRQDGRALGTVVSAAPPLLLAVLPLERGMAPLSAADVPVQERPLQDGLDR